MNTELNDLENSIKQLEEIVRNSKQDIPRSADKTTTLPGGQYVYLKDITDMKDDIKKISDKLAPIKGTIPIFYTETGMVYLTGNFNHTMTIFTSDNGTKWIRADWMANTYDEQYDDNLSGPWRTQITISTGKMILGTYTDSNENIFVQTHPPVEELTNAKSKYIKNAKGVWVEPSAQQKMIDQAFSEASKFDGKVYWFPEKQTGKRPFTAKGGMQSLNYQADGYIYTFSSIHPGSTLPFSFNTSEKGGSIIFNVDNLGGGNQEIEILLNPSTTSADPKNIRSYRKMLDGKKKKIELKIPNNGISYYSIILKFTSGSGGIAWKQDDSEILKISPIIFSPTTAIYPNASINVRYLEGDVETNINGIFNNYGSIFTSTTGSIWVKDESSDGAWKSQITTSSGKTIVGDYTNSSENIFRMEVERYKKNAKGVWEKFDQF